MKCHIAGDLLPLYFEHLLSEETAAELDNLETIESAEDPAE